MTAGISRISLGSEMEQQRRINANDPANSAFVIFALAAGHESLATLRTYADLATLLAGTGNDEPTNANYARVVVTDAGLGDPTVSGSNMVATITDITPALTAVAAGNNWSVVGIGYDSDTTGGTDSGIVMTYLCELTSDFVPNGSDVNYDFPTALFTASPV